MENLPNEIILHIFNFLDSETLRNVSAVCQRFQLLIHNDTTLMNKFRVCINLFNLNSLKETSSDMPYRKFDIFASQYFSRISLSLFEGGIKSIIDEHSDYIENIRLFEPTTGLSTRILENLKNLTHLCIENIKKSGIEVDDFEDSVFLQNLKILEANGVGSYLKCIKCPKVQVLKFRNENKQQDSQLTHDPSGVCRALNNFLKRSHNLKDLTVYGNVPNFETKNFKFKLQKLKFTNFFTIINGEVKNPMVELMKSQSDNIKELTVTGYLSQNILEIAINEMNVLETLKVDLDKIFAEPTNLKINEKLKRLEILNLPNYHEHVTAIFKKCPVVENLKIYSNMQENLLHEISNSMKNLKHLTLKSINHEILSPIFFEKLKSLTVLELLNSRQFSNILSICDASPNLFEIKIFKLAGKISAKKFKKLLRKSKNVEILKIYGKFELDENIVEILVQNDTKLKVLWLDMEIDDETEILVEFLNQTDIQCVIPKLNGIEKYKNFEDVEDSDDSESFEDLDDTDCSDIKDFDDSEDCDDSEDFNNSIDSECCEDSNHCVHFEDYDLESGEFDDSDMENSESNSSELKSSDSKSTDHAESLSSGQENSDLETSESDYSELNDSDFKRAEQKSSDYEDSNLENSEYSNSELNNSDLKVAEHAEVTSSDEENASLEKSETISFQSEKLSIKYASHIEPTSSGQNDLNKSLKNSELKNRKLSSQKFKIPFLKQTDSEIEKSKLQIAEIETVNFENHELNSKENIESLGHKNFVLLSRSKSTTFEQKLMKSKNFDSKKPENFGDNSLENSIVQPRSKISFQIIEIESLHESPTKFNQNCSRNINSKDSVIQETSTIEGITPENYESIPSPQKLSQNSSSGNEQNSGNSTVNESDLMVEIEIKKRPRDVEHNISSEEDISIEISERKRKIKKI